MTDTFILKRRGSRRHTGMRRKENLGSRDWTKAAISCTELPKIAKNCWHHEKLGEKYGIDFPSEPPERTKSLNTLISHFYPPGCL